MCCTVYNTLHVMLRPTVQLSKPFISRWLCDISRIFQSRAFKVFNAHFFVMVYILNFPVLQFSAPHSEREQHPGERRWVESRKSTCIQGVQQCGRSLCHPRSIVVELQLTIVETPSGSSTLQYNTKATHRADNDRALMNSPVSWPRRSTHSY